MERMRIRCRADIVSVAFVLNYPSLNKHLRLSHQYILLYAILIIARIHATLVASSLSASALGVLQVFQHANLVLPCSKKTPYWVFCWSGRRDSNSRHSPWQGDALPLSHSRILSFWSPWQVNALPRCSAATPTIRIVFDTNLVNINHTRYQVKLKNKMVGVIGLEPMTSCL